MRNEGISLKEACSGWVLVARDRRPTRESLVSATMQEIKVIKGVVAVNMGILTPRQLHWMDRNRNRFMPATEFDYYKQVSSSFRTLMSLSLKVLELESYVGHVVVEGANEKLFLLLPFLEVEMQIKNSGKEGEKLPQ